MKKQRGGRVVLLIKQCEHVYMYVILIITFLFVCLFFGLFLVKKIFFFSIYNLVFANFMKIKIKIYFKKSWNA